MAVALMLAHPYGNPRVMSSFDFSEFDQGPPADSEGRIISPGGACSNGWICEHRWRQTYSMVGFRNYVGEAELTDWWDNDSYQIAFCRGDRGFVAINAEKNRDLKRKLRVCLPPGTYCDVITGEVIGDRCTGKSVVVDTEGMAFIEIRVDEDDGVLALHGAVSFITPLFILFFFCLFKFSGKMRDYNYFLRIMIAG